MGFMDRFKGRMEQAREMANQAGDAIGADTDPSTVEAFVAKADPDDETSLLLSGRRS
jgi:hypothetical protein